MPKQNPRGRYEDRTWDLSFARAGGRRANAGTYQAFIPNPIADFEPELGSATSALSERAGLAVKDLNGRTDGLQSLEGLARQLLRSEALASSAIEGLRLSHRNLAQAEIDAGGGNYKAREVLANTHAMEEAVRIAEKAGDLTLQDITDIHRTLAIVRPLDKIAGQLREEQGWIGGDSPPDADYVSPPPEFVEDLVEDFCRFMNRDDISAVTQAAIAHAQFETIHPFGDGNGRVGRCLIHVLLKRRGLAPSYVPPVSLVLGANKSAYLAGLENFRANKVDRWVEQFAQAVEIASEKSVGFSADVLTLQEQWRTIAQPMRAGSTAPLIIDRLPSFPWITAAIVEELTGRSRPAAINGLSHLEKVGILTRHRNQKRGDSWEAKELFLVLDHFEAAVKLPQS